MNFSPIKLDQEAEYRKFLDRCPEITSDYSFVNLWGWAKEYGLGWAWTDNLIWIRQEEPEPLLWAPVGSWNEVEWPRELEDLEVSLSFTRIPETLLAVWEKNFPGKLRVSDARDQWDYLYETKDLINLSGNRFHKKKNLLNQFLKKYEFEYIPLSGEAVYQALNLQQEWCEWRDCEETDTLAAENRVIERILTSWKDFSGLNGGAILADGRMVAYTVGEMVTPEMLLIHFEKGCPGYKGIYQAVNQMYVERTLQENPHPFSQVNREPDLGDEGLRKAKLSYNPVEFMKKYRVRIER